MEIASHADRHVMDDLDFECSFSKLNEWLGHTVNSIGFSVPNSSYNEEQLKNFVKVNGSKLKYIRVGRAKKCYSFLSKIHYLCYRLLGLQTNFNNFNKHNLFSNENELRYCIPSLVVKKGTKAKSLISFLKKHAFSSKYLVIMFHSIVDDARSAWEWDTESFIKLCSFISSTSSIECVTLEEIYKN